MATDRNPQQTRQLSVEAGLTARVMRNNLMLMGPKLFAALPPWVHALEWEKGAPALNDIAAHGAVMGMRMAIAGPLQGTLEFAVMSTADSQFAPRDFVMWAPLSIEAYRGPLPLWLQFKPAS